MNHLQTCRSLALVMATVILLAALLSGCGSSPAGRTDPGDNTQSSSGKKLQVVATIFPAYDFARHIGGENADVHMLLKPGEEVHSYEPTPQDIRLIQNSDLFIFVGGENDVWVDNIMESLEEKGPAAVRLLDLVDTYDEEHLEGMMPEKGEHDHDHSEAEEGHGDVSSEEEDHAHGSAGSEEDLDHAHGSTGPDEDLDHAHGSTGSDEDLDHDHGSTGSEEDLDHDHGSTGSEEEDHAPGNDESEEDHDHDHDHDHAEEPDEHVWTSPENCVTLIENLTDAFCELDPSGEDLYRKNGDAYRAAFEELDAQYLEMAASASRKTILFGDRFPFRYLAEELGLTCYAAFAGCSAESEPSAATIAFLIDKTAEEGLPVVFKIEFSNGNIARAVSEAAQLKRRKKSQNMETMETTKNPEEDLRTAERSSLDPSVDSGSGDAGIRVLELHSCQNVTRDEFSSGETCLSLMRRNLEALRTALNE